MTGPVDDLSVWPDDATYIPRSWQLDSRSGRGHAPIVSKRVEVLVSGSGVEQHDFVTLLQEALLEQPLIRRQRGTAFRSCEDAFGRSQYLHCRHNLIVADRDRS